MFVNNICNSLFIVCVPLTITRYGKNWYLVICATSGTFFLQSYLCFSGIGSSEKNVSPYIWKFIVLNFLFNIYTHNLTNTYYIHKHMVPSHKVFFMYPVCNFCIKSFHTRRKPRSLLTFVKFKHYPNFFPFKIFTTHRLAHRNTAFRYIFTRNYFHRASGKMLHKCGKMWTNVTWVREQWIRLRTYYFSLISSYLTRISQFMHPLGWKEWEKKLI